MAEKAFSFLKLDEKGKKPRKKGVIEIRGPYYSAVTPGYIKDLLDTYSDYVDGFKFAAGTQRLLSKENLRKFIRICHDYNVYVSTGGMVERVIVQGYKAVDRYFEETKSFGFDVIEISSGMASIPLGDKVAMVKQAKKIGLKVKPEVAFMRGAGAGTHVAGYKTNLRSFADFCKEADAYLKAGAYMLMFESEGVTEDLPFKKWRTDLVKRLIKKYGLNTWMFEAAEPQVFKWYLQNYGQDVNMFIDHSQVIEYTAWALKLWGNPDIWKGKVFRYKR